jgi:hypothetical protein
MYVEDKLGRIWQVVIQVYFKLLFELANKETVLLPSEQRLQPWNT